MRKRDLFISLLIAATLRVFQLGTAGYWYDEGFTVVLSRLPFRQMIQATAGDVHPPFYYLISWLMARISNTEWVMRIPSVLFSLAAIYVTWLIIVKAKLSKLAQYAVIVWMVISPIQLHYAQEVRMYALLQLEVLGMIWLLVIPQRGYNRLWFSALASLTLYTQNYGVFYLGAICLAQIYIEIKDCLRFYVYGSAFALREAKRAFIKVYLPYYVIPFVLWIPWLLVMAGQMNTLSGGYWIQPPTAASVIFSVYQLLFAYSMPEIFQGLAIVIVACLASYSAWRIFKDKPIYWHRFAIIAFGPIILSLVASYAWKPVYLFRGLIGCSVPLSILAVMALDGIKTAYKKVYIYSVLFFIMGAGLVGHYIYNVPNKGDTKEWVAAITDNWQEGDVILSLNDNGVIAVRTYAEGYPYFKLPTCGEEALGSLSPATREAIGIPEKDIADLDVERIWYISTISPVSTSCEAELTSQVIQDNDAVLVRELANDEYYDAGVYLINAKH